MPMAEQAQNIGNEASNNNLPEKILQVERGEPERSQSLRRQMQKVPPLLRLDKNNQEYYDPKVVSLGPYHHGKKELQLAEDFKVETLKMFVADSGKNVRFFYNLVLERVSDARSCYIEDSTNEFDDRTFAQMMLLDACFIIFIIVSSKDDEKNYLMSYHFGDLAYETIIRDTSCLLENQIPFWVLKLLICSGYGEDQGKEMLNDCLQISGYKGNGIVSSEEEHQQPFHLLDAFRMILVSECNGESEQTRRPNPCFGWLKSGIYNHLHPCITKFSWLNWRRIGGDDKSYKYFSHTFRSVTDLKAKGIQFGPSCANSLKAIKFKSGYFYAKLEVPYWPVTVYTKGFFLNMIAYEMCPNTSTDREVSAYIDFMKSLIYSPKDVKELREKNILVNALSSDEEVVKVYKEINTYFPTNRSIFFNVMEDVQAHYNNWAKTWLAELLRTYFRGPWATMALLAAAFLLILTFLQTYFTIKSSRDK